MGKRYIDPEAFFKVINTLPYKDTSYPDASAYNGAISDVADMLTHFPAADVAEVRHGRWEKDNDTAFFWKCSECGAYLFWRKEEYLLRDTDEPNYCPNCGAKMDEGGDTE